MEVQSEKLSIGKINMAREKRIDIVIINPITFEIKERGGKRREETIGDSSLTLRMTGGKQRPQGLSHFVQDDSKRVEQA